MVPNRDKAPAIESLKQLGWQLIGPCGDDVDNERGCSFIFEREEAGRCRVRLYVLTSGHPSGQCHFGIRHDLFSFRAFNVFWVSNEDYVLIIPSFWLRKIFNATKPRFIGLNKERWDVNFYFDKYDQALFIPVGGQSYDVTEFRHRR